MVFAAELAAVAGRLDGAVVDRHRSVLGSLGLPLTYRGDRWPQLLEAMGRDKKRRSSDGEGRYRFVLLEDVGRPVHGVPVTAAG